MIPRVTSLNLGDPSDHQLEADLRRLAESSDVICDQEGSDRDGMLEDFARGEGWVYFHTGWPGGTAVPILYRRGLPVRGRGGRRIIGRTFVGPGAGPSWAKAKPAPKLRVDDTVVVNFHAVASQYRRLRKWHAKKAARRLARMVRRHMRRGLEVILVGDFNNDPAADVYAPLRRIKGLRQYVDQPTHGKRLIDHVWSTVPGDVTVTETSSDHRAVTFTPRRHHG